MAVAERLRDCLRATDTAARLGGDEFALLVEDLRSRPEAMALADRLIAALSEPFMIAGLEIVVGASIGIAFDDAHLTTDQLLRNADIAMYTAKRGGKRRYAIFETEMHTAAVDRLEIQGDLRRALDRHEFTLQYQPIVALNTGRIDGVEALVRWRHPTRGLLAPDAFISIAEETGLVCELGRQVLIEACVQASRWQRLHPQQPPLSLSVNLSPRQLQDDELLTHIREALALSGLPASSLTQAIVSLAQTMDLVAVAEGVETSAQAEILGRIGCDLAQGYYLARPMDAPAVDGVLSRGLSSASR